MKVHLHVVLEASGLEVENESGEKCPIFSGLTNDSIEKIVDAMQIEVAEAGAAPLCEEGKVADKIFLLMSGCCDVFVGNILVGDLSRFDIFGESALLPNESGAHIRTATVKVREGDKAQFLVLKKTDLEKLIKSGTIGESCVKKLKETAQIRKAKRDMHTKKN